MITHKAKFLKFAFIRCPCREAGGSQPRPVLSSEAAVKIGVRRYETNKNELGSLSRRDCGGRALLGGR
jgi:hypothetical protein